MGAVGGRAVLLPHHDRPRDWAPAPHRDLVRDRPGHAVHAVRRRRALGLAEGGGTCAWPAPCALDRRGVDERAPGGWLPAPSPRERGRPPRALRERVAAGLRSGGGDRGGLPSGPPALAVADRRRAAAARA